MRRLLILTAAIGGCAQFADTDEKAIAAARANAALTQAQAADFRAYILAADKRQRDALERELSLVVELELRTGPDSRPSVDDVVGLMARVAAKRATLYAQLDAEREAWLNDPKLRAQERIADMLTAYASARSEFSRFVADITGAAK